MTPVYHPNVDNSGRICLDTLKMPPKVGDSPRLGAAAPGLTDGAVPALRQGAWRPSINLSTLLSTIRLLLASPNGDDGLMPEIVRRAGRSLARRCSPRHLRRHAQTKQFCDDRPAFEKAAREWTAKHAVPSAAAAHGAEAAEQGIDAGCGGGSSAAAAAATQAPRPLKRREPAAARRDDSSSSSSSSDSEDGSDEDSEGEGQAGGEGGEGGAARSAREGPGAPEGLDSGSAKVRRRA